MSPPPMSKTTASQQQRAAAAQSGLRLGERLRQLRVSAGVTQTELARGPFSKEDVSQRGRVDSALARAEALIEGRRNLEAIEVFEDIRSALLATGMAELEVRAACG